ncbi:MAG: hypothetical protein ACOYBL_06225 [Lachnospiraceae bacterium]|jgi:hypothetical protein
MKTSDIKILRCYAENPPSVEKMQKKEQYFRETGLLPSDIILDSRNHLIDGYSSYLLAVKYKMTEVPARYGGKQAIKAVHSSGGPVYAWRVPHNLTGLIYPGDRVKVHTVRGIKCVTVVSVEEYWQQDKEPQQSVICIQKAAGQEAIEKRMQELYEKAAEFMPEATAETEQAYKELHTSFEKYLNILQLQDFYHGYATALEQTEAQIPGLPEPCSRMKGMM